MSSNNRIPVQPHTQLTPAQRNAIYSALLSSGSIPQIQNTLTHELETSGFLSTLREYITSLLRSGECTTMDEVMQRVTQKIDAQRTGSAETNGHTNGTNGNGVNGVGEEGDWDLKIPDKTIKEGVKVVRKELEKVCEIDDGREK